MDSKFRKLTKAFEYIKSLRVYDNLKFDDYLLWANLARFHDKSILGSYLKEGFYHIPGFAKSIINSFKPYQTWWQVFFDIITPFSGLFKKVIPGVFYHLVLNLLLLPFRLIALPFKLISENKPFVIENFKDINQMTPYELTSKEAIQYYLVKSLDYLRITKIFNEGILGTLRGLIEIVTTPLLLVRMIIRFIKGCLGATSPRLEPTIQEYHEIVAKDIVIGKARENKLYITKTDISESTPINNKDKKLNLAGLFAAADIYEMTRKWKSAYKNISEGTLDNSRLIIDLSVDEKIEDTYLSGECKSQKALISKQLQDNNIQPTDEIVKNINLNLINNNYQDVIYSSGKFGELDTGIPFQYSIESANGTAKLTMNKNKIDWQRFIEYNNMFSYNGPTKR